MDEDGYFNVAGERIYDAEVGRPWLESLEIDDQHRVRTQDQRILEAFDAPIVAQEIELGPGLFLHGQYGFRAEVSLQTLRLDEWDRVHGRTLNDIPFVLARSAQEQLFEACEEFRDDALKLNGRWIPLPPWLGGEEAHAKSDFWQNIYETESVPRFDLQAPSPALIDVMERIKLPKSRVAVLGAGGGHDAAFFAERGHLVTAFDFAPSAIERLRSNYPRHNIQTELADMLTLDHSWNRQFDVIWEHTCYCAIHPAQRNQLVRVWNRLLTERGQLLGVFFAMDKEGGPPYGGSEWEVRERLKKSYQFLFWNRCGKSKPSRLGKEFLILAQRKG